MIHFLRRHGMTDVLAIGSTWNGPVRINNQLSVFVEEGEERQAGPFVTELGGQRLAAGRVEGGLIAVLLHVDVRDHEMLGEEGLDYGSLDKPIEALAIPSPGGLENQEDVFVLRASLRSGIGQHLLAGRAACPCHRQSASQQNHHCYV